jgi:hypothetical protein
LTVKLPRITVMKTIKRLKAFFSDSFIFVFSLFES